MNPPTDPLDRLQAQWQQQDVPAAPDTLTPQLKARLRQLEREESPAKALAGAITIGLFALAFAAVAWLKGNAVFAALTFLAALTTLRHITQYLLFRHRPDPGTDLRAYLAHQQRLVQFLRRTRQLMAVPFGLYFLFLAWTYRDLSAFSSLELIGLGGFVGVTLLVGGVLVWWGRGGSEEFFW
ncbi:MAG: hypothetical protein SF053_00610 [Bacteroidia bacterium]|nr:hypothetical protein [Bacteroidia bacterium]